MNAANNDLHSANDVNDDSRIENFFAENASEVCPASNKRIPDVSSTKEEYLELKSALLKVKESAIACGVQTTDVKKVYFECWLKSAKVNNVSRVVNTSDSFIIQLRRNVPLIVNCCFLFMIAFVVQNVTRLTNNRCLVKNNYFLMEITRPFTDCRLCSDVSQVITLESPTKAQFAEYAYSGKPILVKSAIKNWTAMTTFSFDFFKRIYGEVKDSYRSIDEECQFFPFRTNFITLRQFLSMPEERVNLTSTSVDPWYIGWSNCDPDIAERLRMHYSRPSFLPDDSESSAIDWIFMGYAGQGSSMHLDYVQRPSWQAQISGSKTWHLLPPPECESTCNSFEVTVNEGDIILIDTNKWYHDTVVNSGKISITIGSEYD